MPRFYFHLRTTAGTIRDNDGVDFDDFDRAQNEARSTLLAMELDRADDEHFIDGITVTDGEGEVLADFRLAVTSSVAQRLQ